MSARDARGAGQAPQGEISPYDRDMKTRNIVLPAMLVVVVACAEQDAPVVTEHAEAELIAARDAAEPGRPLLLALRLRAKRGWHTYWRNPGDSGQPTSIEWKLPAGFSAGAIR